MSLLRKVAEPVQKIIAEVKHKLAGATATNPRDSGKNK